jgi:hypothetical protein
MTMTKRIRRAPLSAKNHERGFASAGYFWLIWGVMVVLLGLAVLWWKQGPADEAARLRQSGTKAMACVTATKVWEDANAGGGIVAGRVTRFTFKFTDNNGKQQTPGDDAALIDKDALEKWMKERESHREDPSSNCLLPIRYDPKNPNRITTEN